MENVRENSLRIMERVYNAAVKSGRNPAEVTLVAASKMNDGNTVRIAHEAGIMNFGENRVQEMEEKFKEGAYDGAHLHFIGHLQRNKVKNVVGKAELIHSVDSEELITLIGRRADMLDICQRILIEINIGGEEAKSGIAPEQLSELLELASHTSGVKVEGLMTIPPVSADIKETVRYFDKMANLFIDTRAKKYDNNIDMQFLSMGMSADFEAAIAAGANMVRVGSAIFGARNYNVKL